jgi:hypothetical protein
VLKTMGISEEWKAARPGMGVVLAKEALKR